MIARGRPITKADVQKLLQDYDTGKGYLRLFWGDSDGIEELKTAYNSHLASKSDEVILGADEIDVLLAILKKRFERVHDNMRNYRVSPDKLTNAIYIRLAELIFDYTRNIKVLLLVQRYQNDYAKDGRFVCDIEDEIFETEFGYVLPLNELLDEIQSTNGYLYTIHDALGASRAFSLLTPLDIERLRNKSELAKIIVDQIQRHDDAVHKVYRVS